MEDDRPHEEGFDNRTPLNPAANWTPLGVAAARALVRLAEENGKRCPPKIRARALYAGEQ